MKFEQYHISEAIKRNLTTLGLKRPTDIQFKSIPSIMKGEDVLAIAQTGTGKTAAFAIPVIDRIHRQKSSKRPGGIKCLVMVPTRELAAQIGEVFTALSRNTRVTVFALFGGVDQDAQVRRLQDGIDILVATPGRMFDLVSQGHIDLKKVETLVLDEADQMLDLGFIRDIRSVKKRLVGKHQTLFFSATINRKIKALAFSQVKSDAIRIQISPEDKVSKRITHFVAFVEMDDKRFVLEKFIREHPASRIIVFVRTRVRAERVAKAMARAGIATATLHGEKEQTDRSEVMARFKGGDCHILIATDVSARGIDVPDVHFVVNYDLPDQAENYVHRVGRTGRGVRDGTALSFCSREEKPRLEEIEAFLNKKIDVLKIPRDPHAATMASAASEEDPMALIREHAQWMEKKRKKKKRK